MFKINKKIIYSLVSLKYISDKSKNALTSAQEIADHFQIPFDTTAKVLQSLHRKGILDSTKGVKGGYKLTKKLSEISYLDILQTINEGRVIPQSEIENVDNSKVNILNTTIKVNLKVNDTLKKLYLDEILENDINLDELKISNYSENKAQDGQSTSMKFQNDMVAEAVPDKHFR